MWVQQVSDCLIVVEVDPKCGEDERKNEVGRSKKNQDSEGGKAESSKRVDGGIDFIVGVPRCSAGTQPDGAHQYPAQENP